MTVLKAHFDGKVLVPDEPVSLPVNCALEVHVRPLVESFGDTKMESGKTFLEELAEELSKYPSNPNAPTDGAAQHDHYLYGTPKR
ncbi:MAG TPA: hypothetical protein VK615_04830 [Candidatus Binatia bacterium]|nr:hypothetical protein [Candidatus Binatia bacterium]